MCTRAGGRAHTCGRARAHVAWTESRRRMDGASSMHRWSLVDASMDARQCVDEKRPMHEEGKKGEKRGQTSSKSTYSPSPSEKRFALGASASGLA